ncbi:MAG: hypothetical protein CME62_01245 [Halobacteriovoraceae bacterium]|nr:hypothetical protein [Halobacteriovoraceae bacterium]
MKLTLVSLLLFSCVNVFAVTLRCNQKDNISALVTYNEFYCRGGGDDYEVTLWGIGATFRGVKDYQDFIVHCGGQTDPEGDYYGLRLGGGIIAGGEGAAFINVFEGVCTLKGDGFIQTTGLTVEGARLRIIRR